MKVDHLIRRLERLEKTQTFAQKALTPEEVTAELEKHGVLRIEIDRGIFIELDSTDARL